jgi:intracellular sulfur oxidation DsrE/DsrF family protein
VGSSFAIVLTEDEQGKKHLYGLGKQTIDFYTCNSSINNNRFGENAKKLYGTCIYEITDVDASKV